MHQEEVKAEMAKRDRICNSRTEAIEEQKALRAQQSGIQAKVDAYKNLDMADNNIGGDIKSRAKADIERFNVNIAKLAAKVEAFNAIIVKLEESCKRSTMAYDTAVASAKESWSSVLADMQLKPMVNPAAEVNHWDDWAKNMVAEGEKLSALEFKISKTREEAGKKAAVAVAKMREAATLEANSLYDTMLAEKRGAFSMDFSTATAEWMSELNLA